MNRMINRTKNHFRLWAFGCSHVGTDLRVAGRRSLSEAILQTEDNILGFDWDIAVHLGDLSGSQEPPIDEEGLEVIRQFSSSQKHLREGFYNIVGNHDASADQWWFKKWVDPLGENPHTSKLRVENRPYPVSGSWERYSFRVGNILFLMMSDRNDLAPPVGRLTTKKEERQGGYPAGAVTGETFSWWQKKVEENPDCIIISAHHHMLKETTVASGPWEGFDKDEQGIWRSYYHGYFLHGAPEGASYLYFVDEKPDTQAFEKYLANHPGTIDLWLGGHTHSHPDDMKGDRSHIERKWDVNFINVSALTRYHANIRRREYSIPMSRLLTFKEGSRNLLVQCYLHTSDYGPKGWYKAAERKLKLTKPFKH